MPKLYGTVAAELKSTGDKRFCGPVAVAVLTGVSAKKAQSLLKARGRRKGQGTTVFAIKDAIKSQGLKLREAPNLKKRCRTIKTLERNISPRANLLVFTASHVLAVKDGVVQDWTTDRLHRIKRIYIVEK